MMIDGACNQVSSQKSFEDLETRFELLYCNSFPAHWRHTADWSSMSQPPIYVCFVHAKVHRFIEMRPPSPACCEFTKVLNRDTPQSWMRQTSFFVLGRLLESEVGVLYKTHTLTTEISVYFTSRMTIKNARNHCSHLALHSRISQSFSDLSLVSGPGQHTSRDNKK